MADKIQKTGLVTEGFYILNYGFVASYVLDAKECLVAFDSGVGPGQITREMRRLSLDPGRVISVFFTHSDHDHVGGAAAFPKARAYVSREEATMLDSRSPRFLGLIRNKPLPFAYEKLADGQELRVGNATIRCIATPGHTSGSMSFVVNDSILVVGDELNLRKGEAVLDRKFICLDNAERERSLRKIAQLKGVDYLCTAHSGYTANFKAATAAWRGQKEVVTA